MLADAGATPDDVDAVFFGNAAEGYLTGQECIRGQVALQETGLLGTPIVNVENACASGSTAFQLACSAVASGTADVALAIGAEKLSQPRSLEAAPPVFNTGWDVERHGGPGSRPRPIRRSWTCTPGSPGSTWSAPGATAEDFARVSVKSHDAGGLNPNAQYRKPLSVEDVLASRTISGPLKLLMCSPIGDGAAAILVASSEGLERLDADPVRVLAGVLRSGRLENQGRARSCARRARRTGSPGWAPATSTSPRSTTPPRPAS